MGLSANTRYMASHAPVHVAATAAGLATAKAEAAKYAAWAGACRQAAQWMAAAQEPLLSVSTFPVDGATMVGPGATRMRAEVTEMIQVVDRVGNAYADAEMDFNHLADQYHLEADACEALVAKISAHLDAAASSSSSPTTSIAPTSTTIAPTSTTPTEGQP